MQRVAMKAVLERDDGHRTLAQMKGMRNNTLNSQVKLRSVEFWTDTNATV